MKSKFRFLDFKVYQDARSFYIQVTKITAKFPRSYYQLGDQLKRAALSVVLNIAEGSAKKSDKDFNRYIKNSLGSINECVACLDVSLEEMLITEEELSVLLKLASEVADQLGGFSKFLM